MSDERMEEIVMNLVASAGEGRSYAFEALRFARKKDFVAADDALRKCASALLDAHRTQTELVHAEANGESIKLSLLLIHAQDHLMTALLAKELIEELIAEKKENHSKFFE